MKKLLTILFILLSTYAYAAQCGFIGETYYCLPTIDATSINWYSLNSNINSSGVNWVDVNRYAPIKTGGINWITINSSEIQRAGVNWVSLISDIKSAGINWANVNGLNPINMGGVNWQNIPNYVSGKSLYATSANGVNWQDVPTSGGGSQTPWTGNIDGAGYNLSNAGSISGTSLNLSGLTISQVVATDGSKNLQTLTTATYPSLTELSYIKGVTSAIQTQIDSKQAFGTLTDAKFCTYSSGTGLVSCNSTSTDTTNKYTLSNLIQNNGGL